MSTEAPTWYVEKYKDGVIYKFQAGAHVLRGTYMPPAKIEGKTMYFPVAGEGTAVEMIVGSDAKPMNAGREMVSLATKAYQATEYIYQVDLDRMTVNEQDVAQKQASDALGRRADKVVYDAMHAGAGTYGTIIGGTTTAFTLSNALELVTSMYEGDIPEDGNLFCGVPQKVFSHLMTYEEFTNSQWVGSDLPFAKVRRAKFWGGCNFFSLPQRLFPVSGNVVTFYAWHRDAIGAGYNGQELNTKVTWENPKTAWFHNNWMDMGGKVLLPEGVRQCQYDKSVALATYTAG